MTWKSALLPLLAVVLILLIRAPLPAESRFTGHLLLGFRFVDTSGPGRDDKYKEDINLRGGPRLHSFNLVYTPANGLRNLFDRLDIRMSNFGGDPFESFKLSFQKYGRYSMTYERKKAVYFYHDLHQVGVGEVYDLHTSGFDRVIDSGSAKIALHKKIDLTINFDRFTKNGNSVTTQDINRIEFVLEKPIQEDSKEIAVGLSFHFDRASFILEEKIRDYKNENSLFLPGYADGGPGAVYPTSLDFYSFDQPYELKANTHLAKFSARPFDSLLLAGSALFIREDVDLDYSESGKGLDYLGRKFALSSFGAGSFDRHAQLYEFDVTWILVRKLSLIGAVRYHKFDQSGSLEVSGETDSVDIGFDTLGFDAGLQYLFTPRLSLTLGYRNETRDLDGLETATYEFRTRRRGFFGNARWDWRSFKLTFDYEHSGFADPATLMSPTDFDRLRVTARYRAGRFNLTGTYLRNDTHAEVFDQAWDSSRTQVGLRFGFTAESIQASVGCSSIAVEHRADRMVTYPPYWTGPGGTFLWEVFYEGKSSLVDASFSYSLNERLKLGGYANYYANQGSWEIERVTFKASLEYTIPGGYIAQLGYRYVDFKEKSSGFNDYKASILELSFGYRWEQ